jgi:LytS/YehU family sensor histidine kinase
MDKLKRYRKVRKRLEFVSCMISIIIAECISSYLGIYGKKFMSLDTALSFAIVIGISFVLVNISIKIADKWYDKFLK